MHPFEDLVGSNLISLLGSLSAEPRLLLALSGGADSVALLRALKGFISGANKPTFSLFVAHVNHGLRGQDADDDQAFCENLCRELALPLQIIKLDLGLGSYSEDILRTKRYQALANVAAELSVSYVVTAHTLSDQVETMLFRLCRGTALAGMAGMKAVRELSSTLSGQSELFLVRPLLAISRAEIEAYLGEIGQSWCLDKSNLDTKYSRNYLRTAIIPQLSERFLALSKNFENLRQNVELENNLLDTLAAEQLESIRLPASPYSISLSAWSQLHPAMRARVLVLLMRESGVEASFERVQRVEQLAKGAANNKRYSLGEKVDISFDGDALTLRKQSEGSSQDELQLWRQKMPTVVVLLPESGKKSRLTLIPWLDKGLLVEVLESSSALQPERFAHNCLVDLSGASGQLSFRLRQDGDRIWPLGMAQSVRLKQYLHANNKLGTGLLANIEEGLAKRLTPLLADEEEVLWVPGYGLSQKVKASPYASHSLRLVDLAREADNDQGFC